MTMSLIPAKTRYIIFILIVISATAWSETSINHPGSGARQLLQEAMHQEEALGDPTAALDLYARVISLATSEDKEVAATAQLRTGMLYERLQRDTEAQQAFKKVVARYANQRDIVQQAEARITRTASDHGGSGINARRVWGGPGVDTEGAPSSDGTFLTYTDWSTGDLAIRMLASGEQRRLTDKGSWEESQQYAGGSTPSPDGKLVAFGWNSSETPGAGAYELRIIGVDGSKPRVLYRNPTVGYVVPHDWSPDGTQILAMLVRDDETSQIVLVSLSDGSVRVLKSIDWRWSNNRMRISPDGRYIVYDFPPLAGAVERDLFLLATDGSREVILISHPANDQTPVWTPDGKTVLFASDRTGAMGLWAIDVVAGAPSGDARLVKNQMGKFTPLGFSTPDAYNYGRATGQMDFYTVSLDQDTDQPLAPPVKLAQRFEGTSRLPAWSPDGQYLAYMRADLGCSIYGTCAADDVLVVRSFETRLERELHPALELVRGIRWSPDGDSLLLIGIGSKKQPGIYRFEFENGTTTLLVRTSIRGVNPLAALPVLSPDGKTMYQVRIALPATGSQVQEEDRILAYNLSTGEQRKIYQGPVNSRIMSLDISQDGQWLAFSQSALSTLSASVKVLSVNGGKTRELYTSSGFTSTVGWRPDGRSLLVQVQTELYGGRSELWRISLDGAEPVRIDLPTDIPFLGRNLSVHPDGQQIVFSNGEPAAEVWVLDNIIAKLEAAR